MSNRDYRIYHPHSLSIGQQSELESTAVRHLVTVLRIKVGQDVVLFNGDGFDYLARATQVSKRQVTVAVIDKIKKDNESSLQLHLVQGIARGDKMDWILQKAVELGVSEITPVTSDRCGVKLDIKRMEKKLQHWQKVVESACEQSGRSKIPTLRAAVPLVEAVDSSDDLTNWLHLNPHSGQTIATLRASDKFTLCIGPEGGFSDEEENYFAAKGIQSIQLGPRVLRTETAGLAVLSILQSRFGDF